MLSWRFIHVDRHHHFVAEYCLLKRVVMVAGGGGSFNARGDPGRLLSTLLFVC